MERISRQVRLSELVGRLGPPTSRSVRVMYGPEQQLPDRRSAHLLWICEQLAGDSCPDNCWASNSLPYEPAVFSIEEFPADTWAFIPCRRHVDLFSDLPDTR
jgi:hypothetical protein